MRTVTLDEMYALPDSTLALDDATGHAYRTCTVAGDKRVCLIDRNGAACLRAKHVLEHQLGGRTLVLVWQPAPVLFCSPEDTLY